MPNLSKHSVPEEQRHFIDEIASLLVALGMTQTVARLYGYLLLKTEPTSLDKISAELEISKSTASVAARLLVQHSLIRRHGERGSKRVLYHVTDNYAGLYAERSQIMGRMGDLLQRSAEDDAMAATSHRLEAMSQLYLSMQSAMLNIIKGVRADKPKL